MFLRQFQIAGLGHLSTVIADEEYLRRAIVEPLTEVVAGYRPVMPSGFGERLSEEEIQAIIDYIRSLS